MNSNSWNPRWIPETYCSLEKDNIPVGCFYYRRDPFCEGKYLGVNYTTPSGFQGTCEVFSTFSSATYLIVAYFIYIIVYGMDFKR
jgi:hypothetical protein